jgi:acetylornithine deacetylase/succinyl-diaminopimelate desuccinylase-like protein
MLLGHTDVVYADPSDWRADPFGGELREEFVWGRGALDMKSHTACNAVAFALLARSGFRPRGDLVLVAEADEEDGIDKVGLPFLIAERPDLRTDYALNEGGGERLLLPDGRVVYTYTVAEKASMPVRVVARGVAGHASMPTAGDNALPKLAPVLERLVAYRPRTRLEPELEALLDGLVPESGSLEDRLARLRALHPMFDEMVEPMLGSTMTPTMASASRKRNVIPARAEVVCDCRVLPGTSPEDLYDEFREALQGLDVELEPDEPPEGGTRSPISSPLADACRSYFEQMDPGALLLPSMSVGFTNSHYLREAWGTVSYGLFPLRHTDYTILSETIHAPDERIHRDDLAVGARFFEHVCRTIGGSQ